MIQEYICPWGGTSKFNYNLPFYDLVAEMTRACVVSLMNIKGIDNDEIRDASIGEVTINFPKDLKYWKPLYDLRSFVYLRSNYYLRQELDKNNNYRRHIKFNKKLNNCDLYGNSLIDLKIDSGCHRVSQRRKISYKTTSRFERVDAKEIGDFAYYLGEGCK